MNANINEELTIERIEELILRFKNDFNIQKLKSYYDDKSFAEILSIGRREISHSSFLAWLLSNEENHSLGNFALIKLFEIIIRRSLKQKHCYINSDFKKAILTDSLTINNIQVRTEEKIKSTNSKDGRIDIIIKVYLEIPNSSIKLIRIIIENKISSNEHSKQTQAYYDYYENIRNNKEEELNIYLFLTPISSLELSSLEQALCYCKEFIHINYQDILDFILEPALKNGKLSDKARFIITEYIHTLSRPALQYDISTNNTEKYTIMAIGENERQLLTSFWENNETLILAAMNAISTDGNQDSDITEKVKVAYDSLVKSNRDYSKFSVNRKGSYNKRALVYEVIRLYTNAHPQLNISDLQQIFPDSLQGSLGIIKKKENIKDFSRYTELTCHHLSEVIYICNQWGNNIYKFIDYIMDNDIMDIKIEKV